MEVVDPTAPTESANSMISLSDARTLATELGVTLSDDDTTAENQLTMGNQYLMSKDYQGVVIVPFQGTPFPRSDIYYGSEEYDNETIPTVMLRAQVLAASMSDEIFTNKSTGQKVASESVDGAVSVSYFESSESFGTIATLSRVDAMISPFLINGGRAINNYMVSI
ncbi:MAG: DnaT-like ssDNA-binding protein [Rickettsiales bacterium]